MSWRLRDLMRWVLSPQYFIGAIVVAVIAALVTPPLQRWLGETGAQTPVKAGGKDTEVTSKEKETKIIPNAWRKVPPDTTEVGHRIQAGEWIVGDAPMASSEEAFRAVALRDFDSDVWHFFHSPSGWKLPDSVRPLWSFHAPQQPKIKVVTKNGQKFATVNGKEWGGGYAGIRTIEAWQNNTITAIVTRGKQETVIVGEIPWQVWFDSVRHVRHRHGHTAISVVNRGRWAIFSDGRLVGEWANCDSDGSFFSGLFGGGCEAPNDFDGRGMRAPRIRQVGSQYRIHVGQMQWQLLFEEVPSTAVGPRGMVSARVRIAGKWTYAFNQRVLPEFFDQAHIWTLSLDGRFLSAVVGDQQTDGGYAYRVIVRKVPIG